MIIGVPREIKQDEHRVESGACRGIQPCQGRSSSAH